MNNSISNRYKDILVNKRYNLDSDPVKADVFGISIMVHLPLPGTPPMTS